MHVIIHNFHFFDPRLLTFLRKMSSKWNKNRWRRPLCFAVVGDGSTTKPPVSWHRIMATSLFAPSIIEVWRGSLRLFCSHLQHHKVGFTKITKGITKRCPLIGLTSYVSDRLERKRQDAGVRDAYYKWLWTVYRACAHGAQLNFDDLTPYI